LSYGCVFLADFRNIGKPFGAVNRGNVCQVCVLGAA